MNAPLSGTVHVASPGAIHQLLPDLAPGDAISNQAISLRQWLRRRGLASEIYALHLDERMGDFGTPFYPGAIKPADGLIYHYSISSKLTRNAVAHAGPKLLTYHNITPSSYYERWRPGFAKLLAAGRRELGELASIFAASVGDSAFNVQELEAMGFRNPGVLPIVVDPARWNRPCHPAWLSWLQDGSTNLLFVGRIAPNKCQHHLLEAFREYLSFDPKGRLIIAGKGADGDPYGQFLYRYAEELDVSRRVVLAGELEEDRLQACYRAAHLFWSMSEHEGFCVPLVEAMWFDVPILAYSAAAVPETLRDAGILFNKKAMPEVAALASLLVHDNPLKQKVISAQQRRRVDFLPTNVETTYETALEPLIARVG